MTLWTHTRTHAIRLVLVTVLTGAAMPAFAQRLNKDGTIPAPPMPLIINNLQDTQKAVEELWLPDHYCKPDKDWMRAYVEMLERRIAHIRGLIDRTETDYTRGDIPVNESSYREMFPPIDNLTIKSEGQDGNAPRPYFNAARKWQGRIQRLFAEKKARFEKIPEINCPDPDKPQMTTGNDPKPEPKAPPKPAVPGLQPPALREVRLLPVPPHFCSWIDKQTLWNLAHAEWLKADQNVEDVRQYLNEVRQRVLTGSPDEVVRAALNTMRDEAVQMFKKALLYQDQADAVMQEISKRKIIECNQNNNTGTTPATKQVGWVPGRVTGVTATLDLQRPGNSTAGSASTLSDSAPLTAVNGGQSLQFASANLGAGPIFLNNFAAADKGHNRIVSIDDVARSASVERDGAWSVRTRIGFALTPHLAVYGSFDVGSAQQVFTDAATQQLEDSAASTAVFYRGLFAGGMNTTVQSVALVNPRDYVQIDVTGGVEWWFEGFHFPGFDKVAAWVGAGVRSGIGDGATATIDTSYLFNLGAARFGDSNTTTLTASSSSAFGLEFGTTLKHSLTPRTQLALGVGMEFYRNTTTISAQAASTKTIATPSGAITLTSPAGVYQVSNADAVKSSLSFPLAPGVTWKGSGMTSSPRVFAGLEWKF